VLSSMSCGTMIVCLRYHNWLFEYGTAKVNYLAEFVAR